MPDSRGHVWYHCGVLASHLGPYCAGPRATICVAELRTFLVRSDPNSFDPVLDQLKYSFQKRKKEIPTACEIWVLISPFSLISSGFMHLACGLAVGMTGLAAGYCIGVVGDKGVRAYMEQSRIFVGMVLILIFGEVLGLYGYVYADFLLLILSYVNANKKQLDRCSAAQLPKQRLIRGSSSGGITKLSSMRTKN